jgi:hypothetical protein
MAHFNGGIGAGLKNIQSLPQKAQSTGSPLKAKSPDAPSPKGPNGPDGQKPKGAEPAPPKGTKAHHVKDGDTLQSIAHQHNIPVQKIYDHNPNLDPAKLDVQPGQEQDHWSKEYLEDVDRVYVPLLIDHEPSVDPRNDASPSWSLETKGLPNAAKAIELLNPLLRFGIGQTQGNSVSTPPTEAEIKAKADEIINANGGKTERGKVTGFNEDRASAAGAQVAELAKTDPELAIATMNELQKRLAETTYGDNAASGFTNGLDDAQLKTVAETEGGVPMLKNLQERLLTGNVHNDERAEANRLNAAIESTGLFRGLKEGILALDNGGLDPSNHPDATPEEVSTYVKYNAGDLSGQYAYLEALNLHKDDPVWLEKFYSAMGPETSAKMVSAVVDPASDPHHVMGGTDPTLRLAQAELVRNTFDTMQKAGVLDQEAMNALMNAMPQNAYVATEIFAKSDNVALKEMFVNAAMSNGADVWDAGAMHVLNTLPTAQQEKILSGLTDDKLNAFIEGAMTGQREMISFADNVRLGLYGAAEAERSGLVAQVTYGNIDTLLSRSADHVQQSYPYFIPSPFSEELQNRIFSSTSIALSNGDVFDKFKDDPDFKDCLSELFIQNGKDILAMQAPDGAYENKDFIEGMTKFFEMALFSEDGGKLRSKLMQSVVETMADVGDAFKSPPMSESDYADAHNGWSQFDHVEIMGGLMGMVYQAAANQKESIQSDITRREETAAMFIGMAFSFVPGAGDIIGKIAGEGASFLEKLPDKLIETAWNKGKDVLSDSLLGAISGLNGEEALGSIDKLLEQFGDVVVATNAALPNGEQGELDLRSAFQSAFSFYKDLVDLN